MITLLLDQGLHTEKHKTNKKSNRNTFDNVDEGIIKYFHSSFSSKHCRKKLRSVTLLECSDIVLKLLLSSVDSKNDVKVISSFAYLLSIQIILSGQIV